MRPAESGKIASTALSCETQASGIKIKLHLKTTKKPFPLFTFPQFLYPKAPGVQLRGFLTGLYPLVYLQL